MAKAAFHNYIKTTYQSQKIQKDNPVGQNHTLIILIGTLPFFFIKHPP